MGCGGSPWTGEGGYYAPPRPSRASGKPPANPRKKGVAKGAAAVHIHRLRPVPTTTFHYQESTPVRDEYLKEAQKIITDANILINVVSRRVKQLKFGMKPLVESLEKLEPEDIALREVIEGKIDYELWDGVEPNR
jgi:DNA-directed RNA polymerase subunit omega